MATRIKTKTMAAVPQSKNDCAESIRTIGDLQRQFERAFAQGAERVLLIGCGKEKEFNENRYRDATAKAVAAVALPMPKLMMVMPCAVALVIGFRSSSNLAAAYGIAVVTTRTAATIDFSAAPFTMAQGSAPALARAWSWTLACAALCGWMAAAYRTPCRGWK